MGSPDELGIYAPADSDPSDPSGDMRLMRSSLEGHIYASVANVADRNALAAEVGVTSDQPLIVLRQDAGAGKELEWTLDGTNWYPDKRPFYCRSAAGRSDGAAIVNAGNTELRVNPTTPTVVSPSTGWNYAWGGSGLGNPRPGVYAATLDMLVAFAGATWCTSELIQTETGTVVMDVQRTDYQAPSGFGTVGYRALLWCPNGFGARFQLSSNAAGTIRNGSQISAVRLGDF